MEGMNRPSSLLLAMLGVLTCVPGRAEPFLPTSDDQVVEQLPYKARDPEMAALRAERAELTADPENLRLALRLAGHYIELGRINGDPRYTGYAQAALTPWWNLERPPKEVLLIRATLRQRVHDFDGALVDLDTVLRANPWNAQARLTRATVLQVQGRYPAAQDDCAALQRLTQELIATTCLASVGSVTGHLRESYSQLRLSLERHPGADPTIRAWILTGLAEMAVHGGMDTDAEAYFRAALTLDPEDFYLLGAYSDFLLDQRRPAEVTRLLADKTRADPLLLRYALALEAMRSPQLSAAVEQLRERFAASRMRGDRVHLREEARFTLHMLNDPAHALQLAQENWSIQREVADVRILLEAATATGDAQAIATVSAWLRNSQLQDFHIQRLLATNLHPDAGLLRRHQQP
jgi:tetratricopeptide (TPR) repeat protein